MHDSNPSELIGVNLPVAGSMTSPARFRARLCGYRIWDVIWVRRAGMHEGRLFAHGQTRLYVAVKSPTSPTCLLVVRRQLLVRGVHG